MQVVKVEEFTHASYIKLGGRLRNTWKHNEILRRTEYSDGTVMMEIIKKGYNG